MAQTTYYLSGVCKWAKVHQPDTKFGEVYSIDLYPDPASLEVFEKSGARTKLKQDEDGVFVKLSRKKWMNVKGEDKDIGPPDVLEADGKTKTNSLVGNGSKVTCKIAVYDSKFGKGARLEAVRVDELVEYSGTGNVPEGEVF